MENTGLGLGSIFYVTFSPTRDSNVELEKSLNLLNTQVQTLL